VTAAASLLVRGYRTLLSPLLLPRCKYHPTCSQYALDALREFGLFRGSVLAVWRLLRCNPLSDGGVDFVHGQTLFKPRRAPQ
jgi:putative membrane protein insertion efficiency factor